MIHQLEPNMNLSQHGFGQALLPYHMATHDADDAVDCGGGGGGANVLRPRAPTPSVDVQPRVRARPPALMQLS